METDERTALFNIEDRVIAIQNTLSAPLTASLVTAQQQALFDMQTKIEELWKLHGLDDNNPVTVSQTARVVDDIYQQFDEQPDKSIVVSRV